MFDLKKTLIYDKKEFIKVSLIQFSFGISEILFSIIAGLSISTFLVKENITIINFQLNNITIFILLVFSIFLRTYFAYLASRYSAASIYKLWELIIEKAFFVIRNGHINLNQITSFTSLIQLDSYLGLNNYYYTFYQLIGDLLLIIFGICLLAITNLTATLYTFILIFIFYIIFWQFIIKITNSTGEKQKFFLDKTISLFRNQIAFRDLNWIRNVEKKSYSLINETAKSLKYFSTKHLILDNVTTVIVNLSVLLFLFLIHYSQ